MSIFFYLALEVYKVDLKVTAATFKLQIFFQFTQKYNSETRNTKQGLSRKEIRQEKIQSRLKRQCKAGDTHQIK